MTRDFLGRMQAGRDAAMARRNRGHHVGATAKGHNFKRPAPEGHARVIAEMKAGWRHARTDAIEQFRFDVHGHEWEGF